MIDLFLKQHGALQWEWGAVDCSLVLADWAIWNGCADSAAHLRGSYASEEECRALVERAGGLVALVGDCAARIGVPRVTGAPRAGDLGVLGSATAPQRQWAALFDGRRWQVRMKDGFEPLAMTAPPLAMWRLP